MARGSGTPLRQANVSSTQMYAATDPTPPREVVDHLRLRFVDRARPGRADRGPVGTSVDGGFIQEHVVTVKRVICLVIGHRYLRVRYPDSPDGYFLRCLRCGLEREDRGTLPMEGGGPS